MTTAPELSRAIALGSVWTKAPPPKGKAPQQPFAHKAPELTGLPGPAVPATYTLAARHRILTYFRTQKLLSRGVVEGLNNKANVDMR